ncbi:MarR family transcriptional regulator [Thauera aromatica]|nr:MarR family transcriptional regulator [Thauera aromatica]MCK2127413.1 MarR family transcriptional regulator [Thauera aromatica]
MANTAIIGIASWAETRSNLLDLATRIEADAPLPPADYHLNFADTLHLLAELPPRRLDTLREIKRSGPLSVYAVAKQLSRNYSNVHADVQKLVEHGLVDKDEQGRVFVPWDDIVVRVDASLLHAA